MEAPEKIYLIRNFTTSTSLNTTNDYRGKYLQEWYKSREKDADVEYIRTDAFIEKVCEFIEQNITSYIDVTHYGGDENIILQNEFIEDFKNFIKGE